MRQSSEAASGALVTAAGSAMFGERWKDALAQAIGVARMTVHRWATGERSPGPEHWEAIGRLLDAHRDRIKDVRRRVSSLRL